MDLMYTLNPLERVHSLNAHVCSPTLSFLLFKSDRMPGSGDLVEEYKPEMFARVVSPFFILLSNTFASRLFGDESVLEDSSFPSVMHTFTFVMCPRPQLSHLG